MARKKASTPKRTRRADPAKKLARIDKALAELAKRTEALTAERRAIVAAVREQAAGLLAVIGEQTPAYGIEDAFRAALAPELAAERIFRAAMQGHGRVGSDEDEMAQDFKEDSERLAREAVHVTLVDPGSSAPAVVVAAQPDDDLELPVFLKRAEPA